MFVDDDKDILNVWNNGFRMLEIAFDGDNIGENLSETLEMVSLFTGATDIQIYKYNKETTVFDNLGNLNNNPRGIEAFYENDMVKDNIEELKISTKDNSYRIMIENNNITNEKFNEKYFSIMERVFKIIFEKYELQNKLVTVASTDSLTGVRNRYAYTEYLTNLLQLKGTNITYSLIDLFRLKYVNDNLGYLYGDDYIVSASDLLGKEFNDALLFRIGGDEFVILLNGLRKEEVMARLENVNMKLASKTFDIDVPFPLCINYGVSEGNSNNFQEIYSEANEILSQDKTATYRNLNIERRK